MSTALNINNSEDRAILKEKIETSPAFEGFRRVINKLRMEVASGERPWPTQPQAANQ